jgi:hypothetical protein
MRRCVQPRKASFRVGKLLAPSALVSARFPGKLSANMGKRSSKRRKHVPATRQGEVQPNCPYCGTPEGEKAALPIIDQLLRSHAELCAALRVAGRQILRFEQPGDESLEKVREVLKRAENIRKVLETRGALPEIPAEAASELSAEPAMSDPPMRKPAPNKAHLDRPVSLRLIRFPKKG